MCHTVIDAKEQEAVHKEFYGLGNYLAQNVYLRMLMKRRMPQEVIENRIQNEGVRWSYDFPLPFTTVRVCKNFLKGVLKLSDKRFRVIQQKIIKGQSLHDRRGKHGNHAVKLTNELKDMIKQHCEAIPHSESHYGGDRKNLMSFDNPELNMIGLYRLFVKYYQSKTGKSDAPIDISTYSRYFNHNLPFTFTIPRVDVCDYCFKNESQPNSAEFLKHTRDIEKYRTLKERMMAEKNAMRLEFDFAQNLPLPKIPVTDQFYKRLLWLYLFNVHSFDTDRSYMFYYPEGSVKKGGNTVCNCLFYAIEQELNLDYYSKIYLFSDACGGQNRNYNDLIFLSLMAKHFQIEIHHLYPVRGHSYCQCDRNFGLYGKKKKRKETVETINEYVEMIETAKKIPFIMVSEKDCPIRDFETEMKDRVQLPKNMMISKAVKITYYPNQTVSLMYDYDGPGVEFKLTENETCDKEPLEFVDLLTAPFAPQPGIKIAKYNDVRALLDFLSPTGKQFFDDYLESIPIIVPKPKEKKSDK